MGRTVVSLIAVAAAVAAVAVGQPAIAAWIGHVGIAAGATASALATMVVSTAVAAGMQGFATLAGLGPKLPKPDSAEAAIKNPRPERVSAYGQSRLYGAYIFYDTSAAGVAADAFAIHDGQMDGVVAYYLGDDKVTLGAGGTVNALPDGAYGSGKVAIDVRLGLPSETVLGAIKAHFPQWTDDHRGDGVVTASVIWQPASQKKYLKIYPNGQPALSIVGRWQLCPDPRIENWTDPATWTWTENAVRHLLHYRIVREGVDIATRIQPALDSWKKACDEADRRMPLKGSVRLAGEAGPGDDSVAFLVIGDLAAGKSVILSVGTAREETRTVAAIAGTLVTFADPFSHTHHAGEFASWDGRTEPRYRSCLAHKHTDAHQSVISGLLACCDGWMAARADGAIVIHAGRYTAPTVSIDAEAIVSYEFVDGVNDEDSVNEISLTYVSKDHNYASVDGDAWTDEDDISARGAVLSQSLDVQVPSFPQARRLAKRNMARAMARFRGTVTTNVAGRAVRGERYINLRIEEAGKVFFDDPVEITALTRNMATGGVTFSWVAADPAIDAWDPAAEEGQGAPVTTPALRGPLDTPAITVATATYSENSAAGMPGVVIALSIDGPTRDDAIWTVRTRVKDSTIWQSRQYEDVDTSAEIALVTEFVPVDSEVDVTVAYETGDGRLSPWSALVSVDTSTEDLAPAPTTAMTATGGIGEITVAWRNPPSPNYGYTRVLIAATDDIAAATALSPDDFGAILESRERTFTGIAAGTWYVWTRAYSSTDRPAAETGAGPITIG